MIKYVIAISLLFTSAMLYSNSYQTDSLLLQKIEKAKGEKKLELMFEFANIHITSTEKILDIINWIEQEAFEQQNMRYVAGSYTLKAKHFMLQNNLDSTIYYGNLSSKTYNEYNIYNPGQAYQFMALAYFNNGYYELAIHNTKLYIEIDDNDTQSYIMLGVAYMNSGRFDLSEEYFFKALKIAELDEKGSVFTLISIYLGLADLSVVKGDFQNTIHYCSKSEELLSNITSANYDSNAELHYGLIYTLYAMAYFGLEEAEIGKNYLDKAIEIPYSKSNDIAKYDINILWFEYYYLTREYAKASNYLEENLCYAKSKFEFEYSILFHEMLRRKIKLLEAQGKYKEALSVQKELTNNKDSIYQKNIPLEISELTKSYELDKARIEKEKDQARLERSQAIIIGLIVITVLLCFILYIVKRNAKRLQEKNKTLYKQRAEVDTYIKLTKELAPPNNNAEKPLSKESILFAKFEKYMEEEEVFKNFDLDRENIALALGTNRQYLADAVKSETGKTFMDYVNDYRLDYAKQQLITEITTPVANIMQGSGFSSSTTFYRLFKEKFGMTPNELRKIKIDLEKEIYKEG